MAHKYWLNQFQTDAECFLSYAEVMQRSLLLNVFFLLLNDDNDDV